MALTKITPEIVAVNAIQGTLIADNAITAVHIATNAVSGVLIADNAVTATHIAQNVITVTQLADDAVEADKIADGVITTNHLNKAMISSQSAVTAVGGDYVLLGDTSDSNNLKKALVSDFGETNRLPLAGGTMTGDLTLRGYNGPVITLGSSSGNDPRIDFEDQNATSHAGSLFYDQDADTIRLLRTVSGSAVDGIAIDASGEVGIGTATPSSLLHVKGTSAHTYLTIEANSGVGNAIKFIGANTWVVGNDTAGGTPDTAFSISDGNDERLTILSDGKVGIGTTSPSEKLFIENTTDSTDVGLTVRNTGSAGGEDAMINLYAHASGGDPAIRWHITGTESWTMGLDNSDSDKLMISNGSSLPGTNYMTFTGTNVGIGTTSPGYDLVVNNTGNSILQIKAGDTSWSALYFGEQSSAYRGVVQYNHNSDFMAIYTTGNEVMRLDTSGKVGIGTTSPAGMLDIPSGSYTATKPALMLGGNIDTTGSGTRTDNTRKYSSIVGYHYSNEEEPVGIMSYDCQSDSVAVVNIGVPSASYNSPTQISFYTGATSITASPSERMRMEATGKVNIGRNPSYLAQGSGHNALSLWGGADNWDHFCCEMRSGGNGGILSVHSNNNAAKNYTGRATDNSVTFYVEGDGDYYFSGSSQSDRDTKENIADVPSGSLALVKQLRPRTFNFKQSADGAPLPSNPKTGFIAQEVESVFGTDDGVATGTNGSGRMGVDPTGIIAHLVNAIKELETRLAALE